jgi:hypothetical protein
MVTVGYLHSNGLLDDIDDAAAEEWRELIANKQFMTGSMVDFSFFGLFSTGRALDRFVFVPMDVVMMEQFNNIPLFYHMMHLFLDPTVAILLFGALGVRGVLMTLLLIGFSMMPTVFELYAEFSARNPWRWGRNALKLTDTRARTGHSDWAAVLFAISAQVFLFTMIYIFVWHYPHSLRSWAMYFFLATYSVTVPLVILLRLMYHSYADLTIRNMKLGSTLSAIIWMTPMESSKGSFGYYLSRVIIWVLLLPMYIAIAVGLTVFKIMSWLHHTLDNMLSEAKIGLAPLKTTIFILLDMTLVASIVAIIAHAQDADGSSLARLAYPDTVVLTY